MHSVKRDKSGKFLKGSGGKPKGAVTKTTKKIREAFTLLVDSNTANMTKWLKEVADESPKDALDIMTKLAEYTIPKLQRTEVANDTEQPFFANMTFEQLYQLRYGEKPE